MEKSNVNYSTIGRKLTALTLSNQLVAASVLVDQGADIHTLVYKPLGIDVLWKPPRPPREPNVGPPVSGDSMGLWISYYRGGWNLIFPNFGPAVEHRDTVLDFHGEAARVPWFVDSVENNGSRASVELSVSLQRSPFHIRRVLSVEAGEPVLSVMETITNQGVEPMECMWAHHPAFGAPFVSADCSIETGARRIESDDGYDVPGNDLPLGKAWNWPRVENRRGEPVDLSIMPPPSAGHSRVLYLKDFATSRYSLVNRALGLGLEMTWDGSVFPYANFWQETGGVVDYPFWGKAYVMAIEPSSSYPVQGLLTVMKSTQTHLTLAPGERRSAMVQARFFQP
jgi:galactose mutarotase-like enzyme